MEITKSTTETVDPGGYGLTAVTITVHDIDKGRYGTGFLKHSACNPAEPVQVEVSIFNTVQEVRQLVAEKAGMPADAVRLHRLQLARRLALLEGMGVSHMHTSRSTGGSRPLAAPRKLSKGPITDTTLLKEYIDERYDWTADPSRPHEISLSVTFSHSRDA